MTSNIYGWRLHTEMESTRDTYLAFSPEIGRGVLKKIDGAWFFIKTLKTGRIGIPVFSKDKVFCLKALAKK